MIFRHFGCLGSGENTNQLTDVVAKEQRGCAGEEPALPWILQGGLCPSHYGGKPFISINLD